MKNNFNKKNKGFTLIELLMSIALFSIVSVIALGSILTTLDVNRKSRTLTMVMNDLSFSLESVTRTIKTATDINGNDPYYFKDQRDIDGANYITYRHNNTDKSIEKCESSSPDNCLASGGTFTSIISSQVKIEEFTLEPLNEGSDKQPRFLIVVNGYAELTPKIKSYFNIQTTVSPRTVNFNDALSFP